MNFDVVIVGGGPAGCRAGEVISKAGHNVLIVEEHPEIGIPTQCTGFVSKKIGKIPNDIIVNKIKWAKFICRNEYFEVESKEPFYVLDRAGYDRFRETEAVKSGVQFKYSTRFIGYQNEEVITSDGNFKTKLIVGADGPNSSVAKRFGLELPKCQYLLAQVCATGAYDSDIAELWFGKNIAPRAFAWSVPESDELSRIGLMGHVNPVQLLENFIKMRAGEKTQISNKVGDTIRYGLIKKSVADRVLLVGDAAAQVKPFSAGGLIYGKIGADIAGEASVKTLEKNDFSEKFLMKNYEKRWKKRLGGSIRKGLMVKRFFQKIENSPASFKVLRTTRMASLSSIIDADFLGKG